MTSDVATKFNQQLGETFVIPEEAISEDTMLIPGTDGNKMSKSRNNLIDIFLPEKKLRKQIMSIVSNSEPLEAPKTLIIVRFSACIPCWLMMTPSLICVIAMKKVVMDTGMQNRPCLN